MATTSSRRVDRPESKQDRTASGETSGGPSSPTTSQRRSSGWGRRIVMLFLLTTVAGLALLAAWTLRGDGGGADANLILYTVKRGDLPIVVTESGTLQSQKTTNLRCEVENIGREREGTQILSIVPNGENVKKGDLLVELDSAIIEERLDEQELATDRARSQQIQANVKYENQITQNETTLAEAKLQVDLAALAVEQYDAEEGGTFQLDLQNIDLQIQTAEAKRLIAATDLKGIEMLKKLGYRSKGDLEQARLAALSAGREVASAVSSRKELVDFTYRKTNMQLEGAVASAKRALVQVGRDNKALLLQAEASKNEADRALAKEEEKLAKYKQQLDKCKIFAPHDGMATYAIERDRRTHIHEGATVRERQRIITLPDLSLMEVKTGVHESVLDWIKDGLSATITVEAFPHTKYAGKVKSVAVLADPGEWHSSDVKVYTTIVTLDDKVKRLRPGMSAIVEINVERVTDVLSVPVQAVVQVSNDNWCYVQADGAVEMRKVKLGKTNEKFVEIQEGLEEGDRVVLNPMSLVEESQGQGNDISPDAGVSDEASEKSEATDSKATNKSALKSSGEKGKSPKAKAGGAAKKGKP